MTPPADFRVLVALDPSRPASHSLRTVRHVAGSTQPTITGLFVEDEDLMRAAALPVVSEVSIHTRSVTRFSLADAQQLLERQAQHARRAFEQAFAGLEHRFVQTRGRPMDELTRQARGFDMIIVSRSAAGAGLGRRAGAEYPDLAAADVDLLFVNEPWESGSTVLLLDGSTSKRARDVARRIAQAERLELIQRQAPSPEAAPVDHDALIEQVIAAADQADARLVVARADAHLDWPQLWPRLVDRLSASLLLVADSAMPEPDQP